MRKASMGLGGLALAGALVWALWPEPAAVDVGEVTRGPMQVSLLAEGVTRVREPYAITAPITGAVTRSPVDVGDAVTRGETVVAIMRPADPALMDARSRAQAEAAVAEAEAALRLAETRLARAESDLEHARTQFERGRALAERGTISQRMLEDLQAAHVAARQGLEAAHQELDLQRATLMRAQAQLMGPESEIAANGEPGECCLRILAPETGTVLEVADASARLVQAGAPLLSIGDVTDLEIELDLLSADAVRVPAGALAHVERWGGEGDLQARVRRVEPAAFTRVSALGIEEQRVRLRLDLLSPPEARPGLGDRYRVFVRLVLWEGEDVLQLPQAALFRHEGGWAVFRVEEGRARLTPVQIGRQAEGRAELAGGLEAGAGVVLFPPAALGDGDRVIPRGG
ncbi:MAG: HlyD family efflux transporter periplasmic adaptor subunit [Pararhodobacter sp.]|nr:HlyD family efflux transporter periplasmic adaptor subunit [Pararhodobacter sp.]